MEHAKHTKITHEIRDTMLRLSNAGLKSPEIGNILNVSKASVAYTIQCYKAAESDDWKTLRRLAIHQGKNVEWALNKLGKTLPVEIAVEQDNTSVQKELVVSSDALEDIQKALNGIGFLLSEILDELRG